MQPEQCSLQKTVYRHNVTPKDDSTPSTTSSNGIYQYEQHKKGIDASLPPNRVKNQYQEGNSVWVKAPHSQCTSDSVKGESME